MENAPDSSRRALLAALAGGALAAPTVAKGKEKRNGKRQGKAGKGDKSTKPSVAVIGEIIQSDRAEGKFVLVVAGDVIDLRPDGVGEFSFQNNFPVAGGSAKAMRAALVRACQDEALRLATDVPRERVAVLLV